MKKRIVIRLAAGLAVFGLALTTLVGLPVTTTEKPHLEVIELGYDDNGTQLTEVRLEGGQPNATAAAGQCTIPQVLCGSFKNTGLRMIWPIPNWGGWIGTEIWPRQNTNQFYADTDGFVLLAGHRALVCAPGGYCSWFSAPTANRNIKITDAIGSWEIGMEPIPSNGGGSW